LRIRRINLTGRHKAAGQAVEKPASLSFFDNKRKKDVAAAAAL
jgi:hypothetical protein